MFKSQTRKLMPEEVYYYYLQTKEIVKKIPDIDSPLISCHIVCRIVSKFTKLHFVDGFFNKSIEHSWLTVKGDFIIDPYPIGLLEIPIVVDLRYAGLPWKSLYVPETLKVVTTIDFQQDLAYYLDLIEKLSIS